MLGKARGGRGRTAVKFLAALAVFACTRDYESPYLPGSSGYAGDEWTTDSDGDGVADSVARWAPGCPRSPRECLDDAKVFQRIGASFELGAVDMIIWKGDRGVPPGLQWRPAEMAQRGCALVSSDTTKVRVRDGLLDAVGEGSAQLTATLTVPDGEVEQTRQVSFIVKVVSAGRRVEAVSAGDMTLRVGEERAPDLEWTPADADFRDYVLSIDQPSIGSIEGRRILGLFTGAAKVTVQSLDGGHKSAFTLTVTEAPARVEAVSVQPEDMYLVRGGAPEAPVVHWKPAGVTRKEWILAPLDTLVASVTKEGDRIVPKAPGRTPVGFYSLDGSGARSSFTVNVFETAVKVNGISARDLRVLLDGGPAAAEIAWDPVDATNRRYTLESDSPHVALADGIRIVPLALGQAAFRAVSDDGGHRAEFTVEVVLPKSDLHVDSVRVRDLDMAIGARLLPEVTWYPADAGNRAYTLTSSNPAVARPSGDSVLGVSTGTATLTLTAADSGRTADFKVRVFPQYIKVGAITTEPVSMVVGEEASVSPRITPGDATNLDFTLASLNPSIAKVMSDSTRLLGIAVGTTEFIIRSQDGPSDTVQVTVNAKPIPATGIAVGPQLVFVGDPDRDVAGSIQWTPLNATNKSFKLLSSSNSAAILIVDNRLRAMAAGTAEVIVESQDAARARDTFTVTSRIPVKSFAVRDTAVWQGSPDIDPRGLIAWNPANATNKAFSLQSLDTNVARVTSTNSVRPVAGGAANVVVRSLENPAKVDTFKVTVKVHATALTVVKDTTVYVGMTVDPNRLISWTPSNVSEKWWWLEHFDGAGPTYTSFPQTWTFKALAAGSTRLFVNYSHNRNIRDTLYITIKQGVESISAAPVTVRVGDPDVAPTITFTPSNATDKGYTLTGGDNAVATVVANKVHAVAPGVTNFTARSNDGGKTAVFQVTVPVPVTGITASDLAMKVGDPDRPASFSIQPSNATDRRATISSAHPSIVSIVPPGYLHAVAPGVATVNMATVDGGKTTSFTVTVTQPVLGISASNISIARGTETTPILTWTPSNASDKGYSLSSGNTAVATVSAGKLKGVAGGSATITVATNDGGKTATFTVNVHVLVEGISASGISMRVGDEDVAPVISWNPADATNKGYSLASSNTDNVTIVNNRIHAVSRGEAQVTITTNDGQKKATITVDVRSGWFD